MAESPVPSGGSSLAESREGSPHLSDCDNLGDMGDVGEMGDMGDMCDMATGALEDVEHACGLCSERLQQPRILSCLHVFCTHCLEKQVEEEEGASSLEEEETILPSPPQSPAGTIVCSVCKQETRLHGKGVEDLPVDIVLNHMLDKDGGEDMDIICTSCKARENAVARCSDCSNFLCPACVTAHQYMRCFDNHKVVSFEEMENGEGLDLQKPIFCSVHITENLKFYCETCQVAICQECTMTAHTAPLHQYQKISDVETKYREEVRMLITESNSKIKFCDQASTSLEGSLSELQMQRDNARGLIEETFQTYRTIVEKVQNELVKELNTQQKEQELKIMDMFHNIEKTTERIEDGCKFAERVLKHGNSLQILMMKKLISSQLLVLINNTPKPELNIKVEFESNEDNFEAAVRKHFGKLSIKCGSEPEAKAEDEVETDDEDIPRLNLAAEMTDSLVADSLCLPPGLIGPAQSVIPAVTSADLFSSMPGIPPLFANSITSLASSISATTDTISSITNTLPPLSERSSSRNSYSPAMSDSGISVDAASTSSSSTQPLVNLANFSKIGGSSNLGVNPHGQITLNNQAIAGLSVNTMPGLPPNSISGRSHTPTFGQQPPDANSLTNLLNSVGLGTSRAQTPQLDIPGQVLAGLLAQPPGLNGMAGMNPITGSSGLLGHQLPSPGIPGLTGLQGGINVNLSTPPPGGFNSNLPPFPSRGSNKMSAMQIRCKFGQLGPGKGQFNSPHGFCLGMEEDIIVADTNNHRVQVFEKTGEFKYQFGIPGREEGQLWYPRKVAVIRHTGRYVVCDRGNERSRMQIFTKNGHFVKKIAIRYIDIVAGLAISAQGHIVAVDSVSPTVFCIEETGNLLKWFDCSDYMREPSDIAVAGKEYFVCDFKGHCVVVFNEDGQFARRIGCESITNFPNGIDISDAGDVLVGDSHGNRFHVSVFQRDGSLIGEFECPYVKVSRCCGLRITSEGYVVTLAKNNHHVLVLNTLYIA